MEGGYGGYSVGNINLKRNQNLYIVVGGRGLNGSSNNLDSTQTNSNYVLDGGYNGGGSGNIGKCGNSYRYGASGGGATHIAFSTGLLTNFKNNQNDLLIVAGSGGGAFTYGDTINGGAYGTGGSAGGYIGNTAFFTLGYHTKTHYATGGTQNNGGTTGNSYSDWLVSTTANFGHGGDSVTVACDNKSGGGSGYYGGGEGIHAPGAGGSSYINNDNLKNKHMTCYKCTETTDSDPDGIKTFSTDKVDENPKVDTAKKGNGYAKITLISIG